MKINKFDQIKIENFWIKKWHKLEKINFSQLKSSDKIFSIYLPPPNITGNLHMGHAFNQIIIDTLIRYYKMLGSYTICIPGLDHAGIATQLMVKKNLDKKNIKKNEFIKNILIWKNKFSLNIIKQIKRMGILINWKYKYFTMNNKMSRIINKVFINLYKQGLIYKKKYLINWDPILKTVISDLEIIWKKKKNFLWNIRYKLAYSNDYIIISTTKPENLFSDVAIIINDNHNYKKYLLGKLLQVPLTNKLIPIISKKFLNNKYKNNIIKINPTYNINDYNLAKENNFKIINILNDKNKIKIKNIFKYKNLNKIIARNKIIEELSFYGLLNSYKNHKTQIPKADRSGATVEFLLKNQWFINVNKPSLKNKYFINKSISQIALEKVNNKEIIFIPNTWIKTYNKWVKNIKDWCISRQLYWGHKIPIWYDKNNKIYIAETKKKAQLKAGKKKIIRDNNVLDTWFSSSLIPYSVLKYFKNIKNFKLISPTSILVTGFDIIFFWVIRMIMMTTYLSGKVPFKKIYIHGLILDKYGNKMSKSKKNTIDPIKIIKKKYSIDILRLTFISYATLGRNINFNLNKCEGYKKFCYKLWNAFRFIYIKFIKYKNLYNKKNIKIFYLSIADKWIISLLENIKLNIKKELNNYRFDKILIILYKFIWHEYCDWYIEISKIYISENKNFITFHILIYILKNILKLLHPIAPFITEELWKNLFFFIKKKKNFIIYQKYPIYNKNKINKYSEKWFKNFKNIINIYYNNKNKINFLFKNIIVFKLINLINIKYITSFILYLKYFLKYKYIKFFFKNINYINNNIIIYKNFQLILKISNNLNKI